MYSRMAGAGKLHGPQHTRCSYKRRPHKSRRRGARGVWSVDPDQPVSKVVTMDGVLDREWGRGVFRRCSRRARCSRNDACVCWIYGVMAYLVTQRITRLESAWPLAHIPANSWPGSGARAKLTATGVGVGTAAAFLVTRLMRSLLFGVSPFDPAHLRDGGLV